MTRPSRLPVHPRTMILTLLRTSKKPMTAYGLLEKLKAKGVKSAPIVYRALAELEKQGSVHKINELGAYIACDDASGHSHDVSVITVCGDCHEVAELHDHAVLHPLEALRAQGIALKPRAVIELPILCGRCAA